MNNCKEEKTPQLNKDIEKLVSKKQKKLVETVEKYGLNSREALCLSQEIDILIIQIMRRKIKQII